jgi:translation initiation factor IF-1
VAKADNFEMIGTIIDKIPGGKFKVRLENDHELMCTVSGKIRLSNIRLVVGDKVKVAMSTYDFNNGIITWRM